MPPPSYGSKISTRSTGNHEPENDHDYNINNSKSNTSNSRNSSSDDDSKLGYQYDGVGIVKSLLGPSFEDAVLRTLEFGKSLIQKNDEYDPVDKEKKMQKESKKKIKEQSQNEKTEDAVSEVNFVNQETKMDGRYYPERRSTRKRIVFTAKLDKNVPIFNKSHAGGQKVTNVSKIRSLDSDLKQVASSPEKIKRQLEALIQINKDEPPEHADNWNFIHKNPKLPVELTVMPSICTYKNEVDFNCSSSCDVQPVKNESVTNQGEQSSTSRLLSNNNVSSTNERVSRKRLGAPTGICQAPEFLSNALGPTLDVSIIDNIKMMRDLFKCESAKGEGVDKRSENTVLRRNDSLSEETQKSEVRQSEIRQSDVGQSEESMKSRVEELRRKIELLEQKEKCLIKQIEQEEKERECRRRAFEEEEKKLCNMKACLEGLVEEEKRKDITKNKSLTNSKDFDAKYEALRMRIACEEEKLMRLKDQYECYKREILEAKQKKEALKRNKSLLDAWDVIASRVCHTRLPSFSRAYNLERKQLQQNETPGNIHCCFLGQKDETLGHTVETPRSRERKSRSRNRCASRCSSRCGSQCPSGNVEVCWSQSQTSIKGCKAKLGNIPFPIQRDITCGLHQTLKTCSCNGPVRNDGLTCSSDDELLKKSGAISRECKNVCRSRSETTVKRNKCARIVKVMWAVTRINIFQDNCRTYEVMDATSTPPACVPCKTEGIFVVKNSQKKNCSTLVNKKKLNSNFSGL